MTAEQSASNKRVMGIGSNVVDVIHRVNQIAGPESKTYIVPDETGSVVKEVIGGVTLNHLSWAQLLGVPTGLFGYQGDDRYGIMIRATMDRHGIGRQHVIALDNTATGFSVIDVDPAGERAIYMSRGPSATTTAAHVRDDFADAIRGAAVVSTEISQLDLDTVCEVLDTARQAGVPTVLDVDVPPDFCVDVAKLGTRQRLDDALALADIIKPAKSAALQLTEGTKPEAQAEALMQRYGARLVAITDGGAGSVATDGRDTLRAPVHSISVVDTTGAGDAFLGGLIAGIYHDCGLAETVSMANACGAACCTVVGAFPVLGQSRADAVRLFGGAFPFDMPEEPAPPVDTSRHVGMQTIRQEIAALQVVAELLDPHAMDAAAALIAGAQADGGRTHVSGVGKCRHIGRKIAATLQSTGTVAYFLDPLDATHGDSGQVCAGDVVIGISNSGGTRELLDTLATVKRNGAKVIGITGGRESDLAALSEVLLHVPVEGEADPLGLAPTSSTTCQLAVGDALAAMLASARGFTPDDFGKYHPGGSLGARVS
jgi:sugar/nucleoside kinase (ribokinase family)/D-arabinose 5-phosphate isomerase GutQ